MEARTYTLKEAVFALNRTGSATEAARLARHIRHWTSMDLLKPEGQKHTGTGRSREYSADEVRRAAVLVEFAKWRVPMTVLADNFENFPFAEYEDLWEVAAADTAPVYLVMSWATHTSVWNITLDKPGLLILEEPKLKHESPIIDDVIEIPASAIVINLSRLLRWVRL